MSTHHGLMDCTTASQRVADAATRQNARNDEGESLNSGLSQESKADDHGRLTSRRTQLFAFECLHDICTVVVAERTSKLHCGSKSGHSSLWTLFLGYGLCYWNSFGASCSTSRCVALSLSFFLWSSYKNIHRHLLHLKPTTMHLKHFSSLSLQVRRPSSTYYRTHILLWFNTWNFGLFCSCMCCLRWVRCSEGCWKNGSYY